MPGVMWLPADEQRKLATWQGIAKYYTGTIWTGQVRESRAHFLARA